MVASEEFVAAIRQDTVYIIGKEEGKEEGLEEGLEKGMKKGLEEGLEKGLEKGLEEGKLLFSITGIRNMTRKAFAVDMIADLLSVAETFVLDIQLQLKKEPLIAVALQKPRASEKAIAQRFKVSPLLVQVIREALKE